MGIKDLFPDYGNEKCRNRNLFVSGLTSIGAEDCLDHLAGEMFCEGKPVFYFHDHLSSRKRNQILGMALEKRYRVYEVNDRECKCPPFDMLSLFPTNIEKAEAIYSFLYSAEDSGDTVSGICRYLRDCILVLETRTAHYSLWDVLRMLVEDVKDGIEYCTSLSDYGIEEEKRFLDTHFAYDCFGKINDRFHKLLDCGVIQAVSGSDDILELCKRPALFLISSPEGKRGGLDTSRYLFNGFLQIICGVCTARNDEKLGYHVFLNNSCIFQPDGFAALLKVGMDGSSSLSICVFDDSVANVMNCHGSRILNLYDAYCIYKTTTDAQFWSDFMSTILTPEVTASYTKRRGFLPVPISGGVVARPGGRYEGTSIRRVEKPLYEPRYFMALKENEVLFYNVITNRKSKKRLYW